MGKGRQKWGGMASKQKASVGMLVTSWDRTDSWLVGPPGRG